MKPKTTFHLVVNPLQSIGLNLLIGNGVSL